MSLVILGGSNLIASYLIPRLRREGLPTLVVARRPVALPEGFTFLEMDVLEPQGWSAPSGATAISVLPLPVLVQILPQLTGVRTIVAIGSTSRFSKEDSADPHDRAVAQALELAEAVLVAWSKSSGVRHLLLRPTLVYDGVGDRNIARMARLIRRYGVLVLARPATGLRQPIHADDVAKAIVGALDNAAAEDRAFNIAGGEILTYRAMAERVFAAQGRRPRLVMLPPGLLEAGFRVAQMAGLVREQGFGGSVFRRMNEDLVFDTAEGLAVLGYDPRRFEPRPFADPEARESA